MLVSSFVDGSRKLLHLTPLCLSYTFQEQVFPLGTNKNFRERNLILNRYMTQRQSPPSALLQK